MLLAAGPLQWAETAWGVAVGALALAALPLLLGALLLRITLLRRWLQRRPVKWSGRSDPSPSAKDPSPTWWERRKHGVAHMPVRLRRSVAPLAGRLAATSLSVEDFGSNDELTGKRLTRELVAAMDVTGSTKDSGTDLVAAPVGAQTAFAAVDEALSALPKGGQLAAALLTLASRLGGREKLRVTGHVLTCGARGPGLALSLIRGGGAVVDSVTLWGRTYAASGGDEIDQDEALRSLAVAGAVWTQFKALEYHEIVPEHQRQDLLGTRDWESYALLQVGVERDHGRARSSTRRLYAAALDRDPNNLNAQFNLARAELDAENKGVAITQLKDVHDRLEHRDCVLEKEHKAADDESNGPGGAGRCLFLRDPLHYQVRATLAANHLNKIAAEPGIWLEERDRDLRLSLCYLSVDLCDLELTLQELTLQELTSREKGGQGRILPTPEERRLRQLLMRIEGPLLVMWLQMRGLLGVDDPASADQVDRAKLAERLKVAAKGEKPELSNESVETFLMGGSPLCPLPDKSERGKQQTRLPTADATPQLNARTRYNLACYLSCVKRSEEEEEKVRFPCAMKQLEMALQSGEYLETARRDSTLAELRCTQPNDWRRVVGGKRRFWPSRSKTGCGRGLPRSNRRQRR